MGPHAQMRVGPYIVVKAFSMVTPAPQRAISVDALRAWLRLDVFQNEDELLLGLIATASAQCERYIDQKLFNELCTQNFDADGAWHRLSHAPVHNIVDISATNNQGATYLLAAHEYEITIDAMACGQVRVPMMADVQIAVRYNAGMAAAPEALPLSLRQGILRLAAYHYANRDGEVAAPAAVTALWQAYRRLHL